MPGVKRLRIFAGPNGSGKSSFIHDIHDNPPLPSFKLGYYVNADDIEKTLRLQRLLDLSGYGIETDTSEIGRYFKQSSFAPVKMAQPDLWKQLTVEHKL